MAMTGRSQQPHEIFSADQTMVLGLVYGISVFFGLATEPSRSPDTESTEEKQNGFHTSVFSVSELCVLCDEKLIEGTA